MALALTNYDPAIQQGATVTVSGSMAQIADTNNNEALIITATTNAVNELTLINSATTNAVALNATGDDSNIDFKLKGKGTGGIILNQGGTTTTIACDIVSTGVTTGKVIDISDLAAITTGKVIHIDATGTTHTDGILVHLDSAGTAITSTGRIFLSDHTGVTTTSGILNEFKSAANDETVIVKITASDVNALGTAVQVSTATTTGNGITVAANAITDGFGVSVTSSNTTMSSTGRLLNINHSGNAGVSAVVAEIKSAAADETVVLQVLASAALAAGKVVNVSGAAVTTGMLLSVANADALTTGGIADFTSNSSDATARTLVNIKNDNSAATGAVPLLITQDAVTSTNFKLMMTLGTIKIFISDQTSPNAALSAAEGSLCLNGSATGQAYWNNDGSTSWAALA